MCGAICPLKEPPIRTATVDVRSPKPYKPQVAGPPARPQDPKALAGHLHGPRGDAHLRAAVVALASAAVSEACGP